MINLQYEAPNEGLAPFVSSFYRFDYEGDSLRELERADRAQFRFMVRGQGSYCFPGKEERAAYATTIIGPTTASFEAIASQPLTIFGWGMTPAGWAALMGGETIDRVDDFFDASIIFGDVLAEIRQQLLEASDAKAQFVIGQAFAAQIFARSDVAPFAFTSIVDNWLLTDLEHNIDTLVLASGLSPRQLERTTARFYGMPPKKLARKYRALRAAHKLAAGDSLDDTELGLSFYDQSHLIREVKQFTGLTPSQLRSGQSELTTATMRERGKLGSKVSPLVSES